MISTKNKNPDTRPLPPGWSQHYNEHQKVWYYVQNDVVPTRTSYVHPSGPRSGELNHLTNRPLGNRTYTEPAVDPSDQSSIRARNASGPSFAQQLYASSMKKPTSPAPSAHISAANTDTSSLGSRNMAPCDMSSRTSHCSLSINLDTSAPPPIVAPSRSNYPPQPVTYLTTSANPANYSHPNEHLPASSRAERPPLAGSVITAVGLAPSSPEPIQSARPSSSRAALLYSSAITPHNTEPHPHRPRAGSHSSRPSSSRESATAQDQDTQSTSPESIPAPSHFFLSNETLHHTRSYQPVPPQSAPQSAVVHARSMAFHAGAVNPTSTYSSHPFSAPPAQAMTPSVALHERSSAPRVLLTKTSFSPSAPSTRHVPAAQYHVSGPQLSSSAITSYSSPPTTYTSSPAGLTSSPQGQPSPYPFTTTSNHSSPTSYLPPLSTTSSFPPPGLISTSSQPPTPLYGSVPPKPQVAAPTGPSIANRPASQGRGFGLGNKNAMIGLAAGAATGIIGGVVFNNMLGGNGGGSNGDMSGLIDSMGNMLSGTGDTDNSGGMLDGIFNGDGTDAGSGGDGGFQPFFDSSNQNNSPYVDPSNQDNPYYDPYNQGNNPYFDPNQGNSGGPNSTSVFDQSNPQQQGPQPNGPNCMHMAHQAYNTIHRVQQHYQAHQTQQQQGSSLSGGYVSPSFAGSSFVAGNHGGAPGSAGQAQPNTGYQTANNTYHNSLAHGHAYQHDQMYKYHTGLVGQHDQMNQQHQHGQASQHAQAGQHQQPLFGQDGKIKPIHVKQFAKGALIAGELLAKLNGVNLGNNLGQ